MRVLSVTLGVLIATAGLGDRARAESYPWCALLNIGDQAWNCGFVTREQCMATVSGQGGFCMLDPAREAQPSVARSGSARKVYVH